MRVRRSTDVVRTETAWSPPPALTLDGRAEHQRTRRTIEVCSSMFPARKWDGENRGLRDELMYPDRLDAQEALHAVGTKRKSIYSQA